MPSAPFNTAVLIAAMAAKNANGYVAPTCTQMNMASSPKRISGRGTTKLGYRNGDFPETQVDIAPSLRVQTTERKMKEKLYPNIAHMKSVQEHAHAMLAEKEHIVVTRFYAPWCKACKATEPSFLKLVKDMSPRVKFFEIPLESEMEWEEFGVPSVPFAQIHHPDVGLVEEMKMNRSDFPGVKKVLVDYLEGSCDLLPTLFDESDDEDFDIQ
mmetsp:Transcript_38716/g.78993  ORF Transcript_38716/g.78993 Transcript_38716/m.78993 type:complete len:212 (-) Transcript_38716:29-664(-)